MKRLEKLRENAQYRMRPTNYWVPNTQAPFKQATQNTIYVGSKTLIARPHTAKNSRSNSQA